MDLRMVLKAIFPDRAVLDQVMSATLAFQKAQEAGNHRLIAQQREVVAQMIRTGAITREQLGSYNSALTGISTGAVRAGNALETMGQKGKFTVRVLEAFVLYRGFVFLQQGIFNTTRSLIDLNHQVSLIMTQLPNFGAGQRGFLTGNIIDVAKKTGQSFQDVAEAEYQIASAGLEAAESIRILNLVSKAAVAGGTSVSNSFNSALAQINAFGLGMESMSMVLDKQFNLVKRGIFSYEQFTKVSAIVAESFDNAGQSIDTANASLAAISQVFTGPQINRGATALRNFALAVAQTPEKFAAIGVSVTDVNGDFRDFIDILEDLEVRLASLSESEKAKILHEILPQKKEGQAIQALLGQMDALKRNYVEQRLALGDLDKVFKTVSGDIQTQMGILKNNVQPGFQFLTEGVGSITTGLNNMEKALPGVTSSLIAMTTAVLGLALATAYLRKIEFAGGPTRRANFIAGLTQPLGTGKFGKHLTPASIGLGIGSIALGTGLGASSTEGPNFGTALGGMAAAGAVGFALGGPAGAGVAAAGTGLSYLFSAMDAQSKEKARLAARSFTDAIAEELKKSGGDIGQALKGIITGAGDKQIDFASFQEALANPGQVTTATYQYYERAKALEKFRSGEKLRIARTVPTDMFGLGFSEGIQYEDVTSESQLTRERLGKNAVIEQLGSGGSLGIMTAYGEAREARRSAAEPATRAAIALAAQGSGLTTDEAVAQTVAAAVSEGIKKSFSDNDVFRGPAEKLALALDNATEQGLIEESDAATIMEQFASFGLMGAPTGGRSVAAQLGLTSEDLKDFKGAVAALTPIIDQIKGDFGLAADVFENLGEEGKNLAKVFREISTMVQGFSTLKALESIVVPGSMNTNPEYQRILAQLGPAYKERNEAKAGLGGAWPFNIGAQMRYEAADAKVNALNAQMRAVPEPFTEDSGLLDKLGIDKAQVTSMMTEKLQAKLGEIQAGSGKSLTEALVEYLTTGGSPLAKAFSIPGGTSLADQLELAAEAVADGLIPSIDFTADQLMGFSKEFRELNRGLYKANLLMEFQRIGEFIGLPKDYLVPVMKNIVEATRIGAQDLRSILEDPAKLAELLTNIEFGDIEVDNSTNMTVTFRVEGMINAEQATQAVDMIMAEMNNRANRRVGSR